MINYQSVVRCVTWLPLLPVVVFPASAMDLTLAESIPAPGNNIVQLRSMGPSPNSGTSPIDPRKAYSSKVAGAYSVALTNIDHWAASTYFTYEFAVWKNGAQQATQTQFLVNVTSTGSFADFYKEVPFTVDDGPAKASGAINLLIHSLDPVPVCKAVDLPTDSSPLPVYLTGPTTYAVSLDCHESVPPPALASITEPAAGNGGYWQNVSCAPACSGAVAQFPTAGKFELINLTMTPWLWAATGARFRRLSARDSPDDTIVMNLTYAIQPGGVPIPLSIRIPVVFYPPAAVMAAWLLLGAGTGWLAMLLLLSMAGKSPRLATALKALFLGPLLACIAFVIVFLAYSAGCALKLFGYDVSPADVLVQGVIGLFCAAAVLLKVDALLEAIGNALPKLSLSTRAILFVALASLLAPSSRAENRYPSLGLTACPGGDIVALGQTGNIIQFPSAPPGSWRIAGRLDPSISFSELTCATIDGKTTVFAVGMSLGNIWVARMDVGSGVWTQKIAGQGASEGIAFDPGAGLLYFSSPNQDFIYRAAPDLTGPSQWVSIFNTSAAIGSLAVDSAGRRLLVGAAFSGIVYSVALDTGKQSDFVQGTGTVNSLSIDKAHNLLFIADTGKRTIWSAPLGGTGVRKLKAFYASSELSTVSGVAVDAQSNVWFALHGKPDVVKLSPEGRQLVRIH